METTSHPFSGLKVGQHTVIRRYTAIALPYILVCFIIYLGFWTTAPRNIPGNLFDEPLWIGHSVCAEAVLTANFHEVCREINLQSLDHSAMAKYMIAIGRWWAGIPAEAVLDQYTNHAPDKPLDPYVRESLIRFSIVLSSLSLLILFISLRMAFGSLTAFFSILIISFTPYWQYILRTPLAEASMFFFSCCTLYAMLLLFRTLSTTRKISLHHILISAIIVGLAAGAAIGVKINAIVVLLGFGIALFYILYIFRIQWLLIVWVGVIASLVAAAVLYLSTPFLWDGNPIDRYKMLVIFRSVLLFGMTKGELLDASGSMRSVISNAFTAGHFNLLPNILSIPLCGFGLWFLIARTSWYGRLTGLWLLVVGGVSAAIIPVEVQPISWDRHCIYTVFALHIVIAHGAASLIQTGLHRSNLRHVSFSLPPLTPLLLTRGQKIVALICCAGLMVLTIITGVATLQTSRERQLWNTYILAPTLDAKLTLLAQILQYNPQARRWYNHDEWIPSAAGDPLVDVLVQYFSQMRDTEDPALLNALMSVGHSIVNATNDSTVRDHIQYDIQQLQERLTQRVHPIAEITTFKSELPINWFPENMPTPRNQVIMDAKYPLQASVQIPRDGTYRLIATGANWQPAPIIIGVSIDNKKVGELHYDKNDNSWSDAEVVAQLSTGTHSISLGLLNDFFDPNTNADRNGAINRLIILPKETALICSSNVTDTIINAHICPLGLPIATMSSAYSGMTIPVSTPIDSLYDISFHTELSETTAVDLAILVDNVPVEGALSVTSGKKTVHIPPFFLPAGEHQILLKYSSSNSNPGKLTISELNIVPRYPDSSVLIPSVFGKDGRTLMLKRGDSVQASWKLYSYGYNFYTIRLLGRSLTKEVSKVSVIIDNENIGFAELTPEGILSSPLLIELAKGSSHSIVLKPNDDISESSIDTVMIEPYQAGFTFSGTSMTWDKTDNNNVSSVHRILKLSSNTVIHKTVTLDNGNARALLARVRTDIHSDSDIQIKVGVDGWPINNITVSQNDQWKDHAVPIFLPAGKHVIDFSWQASHPNIKQLYILYAELQFADQ